MTDRHDAEHTLRDELVSTGHLPPPDFVASLRVTLSDAAAGRASASGGPPVPPPVRWRPVLAIAAGVVAVVVGLAAIAGRGDVEAPATLPTTLPTTVPTTHTSTPDHPTTAEQLSEWVGVRLHGVGNGSVAGYPWFEIESVDITTATIELSGNDGCNGWSSTGTVADGRYEVSDGMSSVADCGPGTFAPTHGVLLLANDEGIDVEADGFVYRFRPDEVVQDAATLINGRRFIGIANEHPFPLVVSVDGTELVGTNDCGRFGATVEYQPTAVVVTDVQTSCSTTATPAAGDVIEIVDDITVRLRRGETVVATMVAENQRLLAPTEEWLLGDWSLGSGRVRFEPLVATFGACSTSWEHVDGVVVIEPLAADCVTDLFSGFERGDELEDRLHQELDGPFVVRSVPTPDGRTAVLRSGFRAIRLTDVRSVLLDELVARTWIGVDGPWRTTSPTLVFDSLDREPGLNAVSIDTGCNRGDGTFRLDGDRMTATQIAVEEAGCEHEIAHLTEGTTLAVDDGVLTVTSTSGGRRLVTTYVAVDALAEVPSADLSGEWLANGTPITIDGTGLTASSDEVPDVVDVVRRALADDGGPAGSGTAYRYGDGWILVVDGEHVQLAPG